MVTVGGVASNALTYTVSSGATPTLTSLSPTSGPVATAVTISGTNFGATKGTSTVTFNGTAATPTSWSATSIVVPVPAGATTGNVVVTVGGLASNALPFTVTAAADADEPLAVEWSGRDGGHDQRQQLRRDAGHEHGHIQRHRGDADELVRDQHRRARARWRDDGQRRRHRRRHGEQRR